MKLKGIAVKNVKVKDGKVVKAPVYRSVSDRIRARTSKRIRAGKQPPA